MTQTPAEFDLAIVGGGMVGTSLASLLSAANPAWRIALIETHSLKQRRTYTPHFDARSTALAYGSAEIFRRIGLWPQLLQHATPIRRVHVSDRGHFAGSLIDAAQQHVEAVGYVIENNWLAGVLVDNVLQLQNVHCFSPVRVTSLTPLREGSLLHLADENGASQTLRAQLTVIADGGDSPMRRALGIDVEIVDYQQTAIIANVGFSQPHQHVAYERFTDDGPLALLPLGEAATGQHAALVWTVPANQAEPLLNCTDAQFLAQLQQRFGHRAGLFTRVGARHAYPLRLTTASEQIRSHLVLMGNAAHFLHPVAGQGFNLALRDCVSLVETLCDTTAHRRGLGELATLQDYLARQARDQLLTIEFSDRLVRLFSNARLPLVALRHLGFIGLAALPAARNLFAAQTMGTAGNSARWLNQKSARGADVQ